MSHDTADTFEKHRDRLFGLAYRMLGAVAAAEDVVQDAYLRWHNVDPATVDNAGAYLKTVVTRLCLDELKSARQQREETYTGPWLPTPLVAKRRATQPNVESNAALSMALLVVLETLTPVQRAVFVLRETFDMNYTTIARIVDRSPAHCRKIAQRAREHVGNRNQRFAASREEQESLVHQFIEAIEDGDPERLGALLAKDAVSYSDGGGEVTAALRPIKGRDRIARFLLGIRQKGPDGLTIEFAEVNGSLGLIARVDNAVHSVWAFHIVNGQIQYIYAVLNPKKLRTLARA